MKKSIILGVLVAFGSCCFAKNALWQPDQKPTISLTQALSLAQKSLGKQQKDFYCLSVNLSKMRSGQDWQLSFGSRHSGTRYVMVSLDKTVRVSTGPFES